jgi:RNA polymerase sigma-70 factor, ECF subfamily
LPEAGMTRANFNDLVRQISHRLYGYAYRILLNREESEDAVQEIFIKLWKLGKKLDEYKSIEALAATMIRNYCIDQLRKRKHIFKGKEEIDVARNIDNGSPYEIMERLESGNILLHIIDQLPDTYKAIIQMKEVEDQSYEEIAEKTNQNINTLRVTLSRARKIVREEYNKFHNE